MLPLFPFHQPETHPVDIDVLQFLTNGDVSDSAARFDATLGQRHFFSLQLSEDVVRRVTHQCVQRSRIILGNDAGGEA